MPSIWTDNLKSLIDLGKIEILGKKIKINTKIIKADKVIKYITKIEFNLSYKTVCNINIYIPTAKC